MQGRTRPGPLAGQVARALHDRTGCGAVPPWEDLDHDARRRALCRAQDYLDAAAAAGVAMAMVDVDEPHADPAGADAPAPDRRMTAGTRSEDGGPVARDHLAAYLAARLELGASQDRLPVLGHDELDVAVALLDELAHLHPGEPLGEVATILGRRLRIRAPY